VAFFGHFGTVDLVCVHFVLLGHFKLGTELKWLMA